MKGEAGARENPRGVTSLSSLQCSVIQGTSPLPPLSHISLQAGVLVPFSRGRVLKAFFPRSTRFFPNLKTSVAYGSLTNNDLDTDTHQVIVNVQYRKKRGK